MSLLDSSSVGVISDSASERSDEHVSAWKLVGKDPIRLGSPSQISKKMKRGSFLDVCTVPDSNKVYEEALREGVNIVTTETNVDDASLIEFEKRFEKENLKFLIVDPLRYHPLIADAKRTISEGKIGIPRILRLEQFGHERKLVESSLAENLFRGLRAAELLLEPLAITTVFASKVKTKNASFFVILAKLRNDATAHIISGISTEESRFEFALNGTKGLITSKKDPTLELPNHVKTAENLESAAALEILFTAFTVLVKKGWKLEPRMPSYSRTHSAVKGVLSSSRSGRPADVKP